MTKLRQTGWHWVYHDQLPHYFKNVTLCLFDDETKTPLYEPVGVMVMDDFGGLVRSAVQKETP